MKELGRLLNRKTILLILAAACICVVVVFAKDFSDCGIDNYKIKVREYNWLINGHTDEQIQQHADELAQDDRRIFKRLAKEYKEKSDYIDGYTESVKAVITNASNMKKFSVFGTSESIANINKTENDYKRIENVQVRELNSRAVEQFLKNDISIYIVLALMIYIIYNIYEYRDNGMWQIIYTAVNGRMRLAVKDTAAVGLGALFVSLIMQLCGLVSMLVVYGGWCSLTAPVQCLTGYNNFTYPISVMTYLFIRYMIISLIVIAIVLVISLVFALCRKRISSIVMVGIIAGAEAFAYQNISMQGRLRIFKKINIINVMNVSSILRKYDNIMIAGVPVSMVNVLCMVCISIAVISAIFLVLLGKVIRPGRTAGFIGKMIEKIGHITLVEFTLGKYDRKVFDALDVVGIIQKEYPDADIECLGECDFVVEYKKPEKEGTVHWIKVAVICFITMVGSGYGIIAYNNDVSTTDIFDRVYELLGASAYKATNAMEIAYAVGLFIGIVIFYDHFAGQKLSKAPTPLEVEMDKYDKDISESVIDREGGK